MIVSPDGMYHYGAAAAVGNGTQRAYVLVATSEPVLASNQCLSLIRESVAKAAGVVLTDIVIIGIDVLAVPRSVGWPARLNP